MYLVMDTERLSSSQQPMATASDHWIDPLVQDSTGLYSWKQARGMWIRWYMEKMERYALGIWDRGFSKVPNFYNEISTHTFGCIRNDKARSMLACFTNQYYRKWLSEHIKIPDYEQMRAQNRRFCNPCPTGWTVPYGQPDSARQFTCQRDCPSYEQELARQITSKLSANTNAIDDMWAEFQHHKDGNHLPKWHPIWLNPRRSHEEVCARMYNGRYVNISDVEPQPITELL